MFFYGATLGATLVNEPQSSWRIYEQAKNYSAPPVTPIWVYLACVWVFVCECAYWCGIFNWNMKATLPAAATIVCHAITTAKGINISTRTPSLLVIIMHSPSQCACTVVNTLVYHSIEHHRPQGSFKYVLTLGQILWLAAALSGLCHNLNPGASTSCLAVWLCTWMQSQFRRRSHKTKQD